MPGSVVAMSRSNSPRRRHGANAPTIHPGVCPATRKYQYTSRRVARDHLRRLVAHGGDAKRLNVYKCLVCRCWHVGHRLT